MANPIYSIASQDDVAVFNAEFRQVFQYARPMNARIRPRSHILDHPLETGEPVSDHKVILPLEIDLMLMATAENYRDVYAEIASLFATSELLSVQSRASTYENMVIAEMPHEERPELFDVLPISLRMRAVKFVAAEANFAPADPVQSDKKPLGEQAPSGSVTVQPDSGVRFRSATGTGNNFFSPVPDYTMSGVATTATPQQLTITGEQASTIQTGVR